MTNWTEDNINVFDLLQKKVLNKLDKNLETAEERIKLVEELLKDKELNSALINYIGSEVHKKKTIKNRKDWLSERDYNLKKLEIIADYLVYPDRKENNILSKYALKNSGVKFNIDGSKSEFRKILYLNDVQILFRDIDDGWHSNDSENIFRDDVNKLYENDTYIERIMNNTELLDDNIYLSVDFGNVKHIRVLLGLYDELKNLLIIDENFESDIWRILDTLDDLIEKSNFDYDMRLIISFIKQGLNYIDIYKNVNEILEYDYDYNQIYFAVREGIPTKIANTYNNLIKKFDYRKYKHIENIKERKKMKNNWFDKEKYNENMKRVKKYKKYTEPGTVKIYNIKILK